MTETTTIERDQKNGRFLPGNSGFGGRPRGSRNKLGEQFLEDLHNCWDKHGADALVACAKTDPAAFCKIMAGLLPKDIRLDHVVSIDPSEFRDRFQAARALLGNAKVIEHGE